MDFILWDSKKDEKKTGQSQLFFKYAKKRQLTLACLETWVLFINHVKATFTTDYLTVTIT